MSKKENFERLPVIIQQHIEGMLTPKTNSQIRSNYRQQLDNVRRAIDDAINEYDRSNLNHTNFKSKSKSKINSYHP